MAITEKDATSARPPQLHKELAACRDELSALAAEEQRLQQELARGEEQRAELNTSLMQREAEGRDLRERLAEREQEAAEHLEAWEEERKALQVRACFFNTRLRSFASGAMPLPLAAVQGPNPLMAVACKDLPFDAHRTPSQPCKPAWRRRSRPSMCCARR